jgi:hypothetical protein
MVSELVESHLSGSDRTVPLWGCDLFEICSALIPELCALAGACLKAEA